MMSLMLRSTCLLLPVLAAGHSIEDPPAKPKVSAEGLEKLRKALRETAIAVESDPSVESREHSLADLSKALARLGDRQEAETLASKASEIARLGKPQSRVLELIRTAHAHEVVGNLPARRRDIEDALKIDRESAPGSTRLGSWSMIISELEALGDHARALELLDQMLRELAIPQKVMRRELGLSLIVSARVTLGDLSGALKLIDDSVGQDEKLKNKLLNELIEELAGLTTSRPLARKPGPLSPQERERRSQYLNKLATRFDIGKAPNPLIFGSLATSLASLGDFKNAEKIVEKMAELPLPEPGGRTDPIVLARPWALIMIADARAKSGEKDTVRDDCRRALKMVLDDPKFSDSQRDVIRNGIAVAYASIGDFEESIKSLELDKAIYPRSKSLTTIAGFQEKSGYHWKARLSYNRALSWTKSEQTGLLVNKLDNLLTQRVEILTRLGDYDGAKAVLAEIKNSLIRQFAEHLIVAGRARNGDLAGAIASASAIEDLHSRIRAFGKIVDEVAPEEP